MNDWELKIQKNLIKFFRDLEEAINKSGRTKDKITVLFATKYLKSEQLASFISLYHQLRGESILIGENKVQDAAEKFAFLKNERTDLYRLSRKIMIGNLQKNKMNKALKIFDEIWGVDSLETANELNMRVLTPSLPIFLEINISGEAAKHGISKNEAENVIGKVRRMSKMKLKGLMTMAPEIQDREHIKLIFRDLKQIALRHDLLTSMGMSSDWKEAVQEGSDILRIGSKVFRVEV